MSSFKYTINDIEISNELFKSRCEKITELTKAAPQLTLAQFVKSVKPGDVLIAYPRTSKIPFFKKISTTINQFIQGSSFTSSKLIGKDGREVIGYDARMGHGLTLSVCPVTTFLKDHEVTLLFRRDDLTQAQIDKLVRFMYDRKREGTPYAFDKVFQSVLKHLTNSASETDDSLSTNNEIVSESSLKEKISTLFCSSIIGYAYRVAGATLKYLTNVTDDYVWPRDLMMSPNLRVIGGFFAKESGLRK